jgi:uncharacterized membrane protein
MLERIMGPGRLEPFSDAVIVVITVMVRDLRVPASQVPAALPDVWIGERKRT